MKQPSHQTLTSPPRFSEKEDAEMTYILSHIDPEGDYLYRLYRATDAWPADICKVDC